MALPAESSSMAASVLSSPKSTSKLCPARWLCAVSHRVLGEESIANSASAPFTDAETVQSLLSNAGYSGSGGIGPELNMLNS